MPDRDGRRTQSEPAAPKRMAKTYKRDNTPNDEFWRSLNEVWRSMSGIYNILGIVVAVVACLNFVNSLGHLHLSTILSSLLATYRAIVHGAINWVTLPFRIRLPGYVDDLLFLYVLIGGSFMRARASEIVYRGDWDPKSMWVIARILIWPERWNGCIKIPGESAIPLNSSRVSVAYSRSPAWFRRVLDMLLWPRVARQYWRRPRVFRNEYLGTFPSFEVGYQPGQQKIFIYDRRYMFAAQISAVLAASLFVVLINAFLLPPTESTKVVGVPATKNK
ncbi:MAG: hypothetical protein WA085_05015 [Sphingobium sp.]|uniref:hypothetical protein n=1 Tax=Sphingobium sp. CECT 9361 TaxID=2845384 RepID=UPI001E4035DC|nr:hypothetical protein [Sphingobium sp. CECT 9361]CAH0356658.1 hypothetical protein SPH9361_04301 [Sphingobium sp. CECT 9361]